ncbi:SMI1/KNR4 family protein [Kitasatospora sp. NPDC094015]|uniref:SMI1/KNR4 family protein n=1 Tax=Kitasatospora sp. NPDC094015 TaxID=3155205 RepID=UPI00332B9E2F
MPEKVFGARRQGFGHRFALDPPLSEGEVAQAEEELGVSFPAAYRSFLLEVGAGGAGPHYGIFPLRRDAQGWHWDEGGGRRGVNTLLAQPFPSEAERARRADELDAREPVGSDFPDHSAYRAAYRVWDDEWESLQTSMTAGAICLNHQGCGYFTWFVVTGPECGTLWTDLRGVDRLLEPLTAEHGRVDFGDWYLRWLSRATAQAHGA